MMKKIIFILFASLTLSTVSAQQSKNEKAIIKTAIYCDHCRECETCGKNFQANMLKIKGVKMYELNEKDMTITVYFNPKKTSLENIKNNISKLGYDADEIKADVAAYEQLDGCCKKE